MKILPWRFLALPFLLAACAGPQGSTTLTYLPGQSPIVADSTVSALTAAIPVIDSGLLGEGQAGERVDIDAVEMLREAQLGRVWARSRLHRALVVGHPAICPYHRISVDQPTAERASSFAMQGCVRYMQELSSQIGVDCSCRLAALDDTLLMAPAELPYRTELPTLVMRITGGSERTWPGLLSISGRTGRSQPLGLRSLAGEVECVGTYDTTGPARGEFTVSCNDVERPLKGAFQVLGNYKGNSYGLAAARSGDETLLIVFGLEERTFLARLKELRANENYLDLIQF